MAYNDYLYTAPTTEPLTLDEVKSYLRVDFNDDDVYIRSLIITARKYCENYQNRAYITQTRELTLDDWPSDDIIEIPRGKLQSITSIKYKDYAGAETTISSSDYVVSTKSEKGRIAPAYDKSWPSFTAYPLDPITVRYVCGYGTSEDVPETIKQAILFLISFWYDNRTPLADTSQMSKEIEFTVKALLWQDRLCNF
jgi:uncharacterized phiE125 gp8 family phage protein